MTVRPVTKTDRGADATKCFARSVVDTLGDEPSLEAVTIDPAQQKISVATLGRTDVEKLTQRLTDKFHSAQGVGPGPACSLLDGKGECAVCDLPLSAAERKNITIQRDGASTTIARITCRPHPSSGAGATLHSRASRRVRWRFLMRITTTITPTNGSCNWLPRLCAVCSDCWPRLSCPRHTRLSRLLSLILPAGFIRRKKSGSVCKNAFWMCIF